jgi:hypothetical protein
MGIAGPAGLAILSPLPVAMAFGLLLALAVALSLVGGALRRPAEPWLCGYATETEANRYGARNLYREVLRYFPWVQRPLPVPDGSDPTRRPAGPSPAAGPTAAPGRTAP